MGRTQHTPDIQAIQLASMDAHSDCHADGWWDRVEQCRSVSPRGVFAFGTAARLHRLPFFDDYDEIEILCPKGWYPPYPAWARVRHTRGLTPDDIVCVESPVGPLQMLDLATMLVLLGAVSDERSVERAIGDALAMGLTSARLRSVAERWASRGRSGPPMVLRVLDDRLGRRLPDRWFKCFATQLAQHVANSGSGHMVVRHHQVGNTFGRRGIEVAVAVPSARVAIVERPSDRVVQQLRERSWTVVNIGWRDIDRASLVATRVAMTVAHAQRQRLAA